MLSAYSLSAQQTDYNQVVQPVDTKARDLAEYLVQLAWINNPESAIAQTEIKQAEDEAKNVRKEWMRDIQATTNLNEANLRRQTGVPLLDPVKYPQVPSKLIDTLNQRLSASNSLAGNSFFPRYNFGLTLNLFNIVSQKTKNRISKREVDIATHRMHQTQMQLRAETLARYAKFRLAKEILQTRAQSEQDANNNFTLIQQLYRQDKRTFDEYSRASSILFDAKEARLKAETEIMIAKFQLEEIIGIPWELVQHPAKEQ